MIELTKDFPAVADALWAIVGTPDRTDWVPGVNECEFDGQVRRMTMQGAGIVVERILSVNDETRRIEYSCIESAAPLQSHLAAIEVQSTGDQQCRMIWTTSVEPVAVEPFIVKQMQASFEQLEKMLV